MLDFDETHAGLRKLTLEIIETVVPRDQSYLNNFEAALRATVVQDPY